MQIANILLSLGGDNGNTIPKFSVTAAEIAVLRAIHGDEAVNDIEPTGQIKRSNREERARLMFTYGAAKTPHDQKPIVEGMFPGVAARVFETLDELELDESFYKPIGRMKANSVVEGRAARPAMTDETPSHDELVAIAEAHDELENDGIGEINDGHGGDKDILG